MKKNNRYKLHFKKVALFTLIFIAGGGHLFNSAKAVELNTNTGVLDSLIMGYEAGPLFIFQNEGNYGQDGTDYTAGDVGQQRNLLIGRRTSAEMRWAENHSLIFLYAPLDLTTTVELEKDIHFKDTLFKSGTTVDHRYLFDGYRISYLYRKISSSKVTLDIGGSLQVRNAEVSFKEAGGDKYETENDIGIVYALKGRLIYSPSGDGLRFIAETDGFSTFGLLGDSVKGAIYDLRLGLGFPVSTSTELIFHTSLLGGGAEVKDKNIDNWGNFGAATIGIKVDIAKLLAY